VAGAARTVARMHHVISVDLKGLGRSDKPFDRAYGLLDQVRLLKRLINRRGLHDVTLVGHSFGGGVALALALALNAIEPDAVRQLVLIDSVAYRQSFPLFVRQVQTPLLGEAGIYGSLPELVAYKRSVGSLPGSPQDFFRHSSSVCASALRAGRTPCLAPDGEEHHSDQFVDADCALPHNPSADIIDLVRGG